jgi:hypothetical protein
MWIKTRRGRIVNLSVFRSLGIEPRRAGEFAVVAGDPNCADEPLVEGNILFCERVLKTILDRISRGRRYLDLHRLEDGRQRPRPS